MGRSGGGTMLGEDLLNNSIIYGFFLNSRTAVSVALLTLMGVFAVVFNPYSTPTIPDVFVQCDADLPLALGEETADTSDNNSEELRYFLNRIEETPVNTQPFEWFYICDLLPASLYQDLVTYFPPLDVMPEVAPGAHKAFVQQQAKEAEAEAEPEAPAESAEEYSRTTRRLLKHGKAPRKNRHTMSVYDLTEPNADFEAIWPEASAAVPVWQTFESMMFSPLVEDLLWKKFNMTVRPKSRDMRIQNDKEGYALGVHSDKHGKIFTMMFYVPEPELEHRQRFEYGTCVHTPAQYEKRDQKQHDAGVCYKMFQFSSNTGYAFKVTPTSFHSVPGGVDEERGLRRTILLNWYDDTRESASLGGLT